MKIAITADNHLTSVDIHPERFEVLRGILRECGKLGVDQLLIAGDLFDQSPHNLADFEAAYKEARPDDLQVIVIPGNHDADLLPGSLAAEGLTVLTEPTLLEVEGSFALLLVPYKVGTTLGEHIAPFRDQLTPDQWALISHGDWLGGLRAPDANEPGVYMPLNRTDLVSYRPAMVLLGHIHRPADDGLIHYVGSPCPLDINETGLRRFLLLDTDTKAVSDLKVDSPVLYFNETVVLLPVDDEEAYLRDQLAEHIAQWDVPAGWEDRVQVRLRLTGYVADRSAAEKVAKQQLKQFNLYEGALDLAELYHTQDADRIEIARQAQAWVEQLEWSEGYREPTKAEILRQALGVIYGG